VSNKLTNNEDEATRLNLDNLKLSSIDFFSASKKILRDFPKGEIRLLHFICRMLMGRIKNKYLFIHSTDLFVWFTVSAADEMMFSGCGSELTVFI